MLYCWCQLPSSSAPTLLFNLTAVNKYLPKPLGFLCQCVPTDSPSRIRWIRQVRALLNAWSFQHSDPRPATTFIQARQLRPLSKHPESRAQILVPSQPPQAETRWGSPSDNNPHGRSHFIAAALYYCFLIFSRSPCASGSMLLTVVRQRCWRGRRPSHLMWLNWIVLAFRFVPRMVIKLIGLPLKSACVHV